MSILWNYTLLSLNMSTNERNIEIALMLGWIPYKGLNPKWNNSFETNSNSKIFNKVVEVLQFHLDWNWLMESINFIEEMSEIASIQIENNFCTLWVSTESSKFQDISVESASSKIEATFLVVSEFAKIYNTP